MREWRGDVVALVMLFGLLVAPAARGQTVFRYSAFQGSGKDLPVVFDAGGAGNDGLADETTKLGSATPTDGVPTDAGNRSLDGRGLGGVVSGGTSELLNAAIAEAGGFTLEAWFRWDGTGSVNSILDYAGTEKLVIDTNVGAGDELRMRINSDPNFDSIIGSVAPGQWHYAAAVFDTLGNAVDGGAITGEFRLYLDGQLMSTTDSRTVSEFGDSLDRPIGIGKHPLNFEADRFAGLVFEPRVTLGALAAEDLLYVVPEPHSVALFACGMVPLLRRRRGT